MVMIKYVEGIDINAYLKLRKTTPWNQIPEHQAIIGIQNAAYSVSAINENNETVGIGSIGKRRRICTIYFGCHRYA